MITDLTSTKFITPLVHVWSRYRVELGNNDKAGDARLSLYIAPEVSGNDNEFVYLETNGDPVLVGWLDGTSFSYTEDAHEWLASEPWIAEAVAELV